MDKSVGQEFLAEVKKLLHAGELVPAAQVLAVHAHSGQVDRAGLPYVGHVSRVASHTALAGGPADAVAVAWLHDAVEDTWVSGPLLLDLGFPDTVVGAVLALTRREGQTPSDYASRIVGTEHALLVKQADLKDNRSPARQRNLDLETRMRLKRKYDVTEAALKDALSKTHRS